MKKQDVSSANFWYFDKVNSEVKVKEKDIKLLNNGQYLQYLAEDRLMGMIYPTKPILRSLCHSLVCGKS